MDDHNHETPVPVPADKQRIKMVQINLMFTCDTDEEAILVKHQVDHAIEAFPKIVASMTIGDRPNPRMQQG